MKYPMKVVAHKTGLTPETLRAWERRYDGIRPDRDEKHRRLYSDELMEKLILLSMLVDQGYRIGDIAHRSNVNLRHVVESLSPPSPADYTPDPSIERALEAVLTLDTVDLWAELERATNVYGRLDIVDDFTFPLLHRVQDMYDAGLTRRIHLSFVKSSLQIFLSTLLAPMTTEERRPAVVLAYPLGQTCEVGGVASSVHVLAAGARPMLLGGDIPSEEIVAAVLEVGAAAVIMIAVTKTYDTTVINELARVRRGVAAAVPVYFGGHMPIRLVRDIEHSGLTALKDMTALRAAVAHAGPR